MTFEETTLAGAYLVKPVLVEDERGFFARTYCEEEFAAHGLQACAAQCSISFNLKAGTLRGLHYQRTPREEAKLVRCLRGAIFDVVVDLRPESGTFGRWYSAELSEQNRHSLYVPRGFAHGFQTLTGETELLYQISEFYRPDLAAGIRWNDPELAIAWPYSDPIISGRDAALPAWQEVARRLKSNGA